MCLPAWLPACRSLAAGAVMRTLLAAYMPRPKLPTCKHVYMVHPIGSLTQPLQPPPLTAAASWVGRQAYGMMLLPDGWLGAGLVSQLFSRSVGRSRGEQEGTCLACCAQVPRHLLELEEELHTCCLSWWGSRSGWRPAAAGCCSPLGTAPPAAAAAPYPQLQHCGT